MRKIDKRFLWQWPRSFSTPGPAGCHRPQADAGSDIRDHSEADRSHDSRCDKAAPEGTSEAETRTEGGWEYRAITLSLLIDSMVYQTV